MSRLETTKFALPDDLPPELLRRLQVEELWARRIVLAGVMNADRLKVYVGRRTDMAGGCAPADVAPATDRLARPAATVLQMKDRKSASRA